MTKASNFSQTIDIIYVLCATFSIRIYTIAAAVDIILGSDGTTTISCPATNVTVVVEYGAPVVPPISFPGATLADDTVTVTFTVSNLEDNPADFTVMLDTCDSADPVDPIIVSLTYTDDQGNSPDLTPAVEVGNGTFPPGMMHDGTYLNRGLRSH